MLLFFFLKALFLPINAGTLAWSPPTCTDSSIIIGPDGSELGVVGLGLGVGFFFPFCLREECG